MKQKYKKKPSSQRIIASERVKNLIQLATRTVKEDEKLANRYIKLARKIAMKYKVKIPSELKKRFCKHCHSALMPGENSRIRLTKGKVVYYCMKCRKFMRFRYK